jgi:hypothetical protein
MQAPHDRKLPKATAKDIPVNQSDRMLRCERQPALAANRASNRLANPAMPGLARNRETD